MPADIVVVGGGVAGVSCVERLLQARQLHETTSTTRLTFVTGRHGHLKVVTNYEKVGHILESFEVGQKSTLEFGRAHSAVRLLQADVVDWNPAEKWIALSDQQQIPYSQLVIATGAQPKSLLPAQVHDRHDDVDDHDDVQLRARVLRIRDTDTVRTLQRSLESARRILILGDGGIAMETAYELQGLEVIWALKSGHVGVPFFDETTALALEQQFQEGRHVGQKPEVASAHFKQFLEANHDHPSTSAASESSESPPGCSLGPHWLARLQQPVAKPGGRSLTVLREVTVTGYALDEGAEHPLKVMFADGDSVQVDFVIEALGVRPGGRFWSRFSDQLKLAEDDGILVDERMRTSVPDVFACGDVCTVHWATQSALWKQMRLWTQARQLGHFTADCLLEQDKEDEDELPACFELFAHCTSFAGRKVVLLGDFLAETPDLEHNFTTEQLVRLAVSDNRLRGACLVGDTGLEEVFEQLLLTGLSLVGLPRPLCSQSADLADFFD